MLGDNLQELIVSYTHVGPGLQTHMVKVGGGVFTTLLAPDWHISLSHVYWCLHHVFSWPMGTAVWHNL